MWYLNYVDNHVAGRVSLKIVKVPKWSSVFG